MKITMINEENGTKTLIFEDIDGKIAIEDVTYFKITNEIDMTPHVEINFVLGKGVVIKNE